MVTDASIKANFITGAGAGIKTRYLHAVPREGDYVRFGTIGEEISYRVDQVIWIFDEDCVFQRVNIIITDNA